MLRIKRHWQVFSTCLTLLAPLPVLAEDINQEMQKAGTAMSRLIPFVYNDNQFRAANNREFIGQQLDQLIVSMEAAPRLVNNHALLRQISQASLLNQLRQAKTLFNTGNYATAQFLLSGAPVICSSCHIQDGVSAKSAPVVNREHFANEFSYAEFNYYIRNYAVATVGYEKHLQLPDVKSSLIQGGKTLERLLDIGLITERNYDRTKEKLQEYQQIPGLDLELKLRLDQWISGINTLARQDLAQVDLEPQAYKEFSEGFNLKHEFVFDETRRPLALVWRAELQKRSLLATDPTQAARHLYLIAILERMLGESADLSLANLYLKECVALNVADYSLKCMNEYENHLYFYYGGSDGENLPPEALDEITQMRKSLKPGA